MKFLHYYKILSVFIVLLAIAGFVFLFFHKNSTIKEILATQNKLNTDRYESAYRYYKMVSKAVDATVVQTPQTLNILKKIEGSNPKELDILRKELQQHLQKSYLDLKDLNFKQFHFHLRDNTSFLRMHKPEKYGDDLTDYRYGVTLANNYLVPVDGFEEGRVISAFRFIYPIKDENNTHLGSVEISVNPLGMERAMYKYFESDIHFIIRKDIVNQKIWKKELKKYYKDSLESPLYYLESSTKSQLKSHNHKSLLNHSFRLAVREKMSTNKVFSLYVKKQIVTFIPIKNIKNQYVAYFVIYSNNDEIDSVICLYWILNAGVVIIFFIFLYLLYKDYMYRVLSIRTNKRLSLQVSHEIKKNKRQSLRNYINLFNTIPYVAVIVDPETSKLIDVNTTIVQKYGFTREELLNMTIYDLGMTSKKMVLKFLRDFREKGANSFETIHRLKDGSEVDVLVHVSPLILEEKTHYLLIYTDVTNIKKAQKELQSHRETLELIVYILNELIINSDFNQALDNSLEKVIDTLDIDRVYVFKNHTVDGKLFCSQRFERVKENITQEIDNIGLQNVPYDEAGILRWAELFSNHEYVEGLVKDFPEPERVLLESQDIKSILVMPIWDGEELWGFIGFDDCVHQRVWHKLEKDVLQSLCYSFMAAYKKEQFSDELKTRVNKQLENLREKDEQLVQQAKLVQMGDMISMIAHQWRQPLNTISATGINLSLLSNMGMLSDDKVQEDTIFIQDQCQKMSSTIDTFINFVKPTKESKEFELVHAVNSVLEIMGSQLKNHNITVEVSNLLTKDDKVFGHEDLLEQVIINLFSNARDAFEELKVQDKKIKVEIKSVDSVLRLTVEDNAGGVPLEIQDKIFNPYFTTKEQGSGIGIGLYMSMDIIQKRFNGILSYSTTEEGSLFSVVFGGGGRPRRNVKFKL